MGPMAARFLKEWVGDSKEQAGFWCLFIYQGLVLLVMYRKIWSKVPSPWDLYDVLTGLGYCVS